MNSENFKKLVIVLLVILILLLSWYVFFEKDNTQNVVINIPKVTPEASITPTIFYSIPIETLMPTSIPVGVVPIVIETETPTVIVTATPTVEPIEVPTATSAPTVVPSSTPTIAPTDIPTVAPTNTPAVDTTTTIKSEVDKMFVGNEILPSYDKEKGYDLYYYIDMSNVDNVQLFWYLSDAFIQKVAHSVNLNFNGRIGLEALRYTLTFSYTDLGKLQIAYTTENTQKMQNILSGINGNQYGEANLLMLDFLYENTVRNPQNDNERLLIVTK